MDTDRARAVRQIGADSNVVPSMLIALALLTLDGMEALTLAATLKGPCYAVHARGGAGPNDLRKRQSSF